MPYFESEKDKDNERVPIQETKCWSCARLRQRTDGNFHCPKNQVLPNMLPQYFGEKCTSYEADIKQNRNECVYTENSTCNSDVELAHHLNRTVSREEQIRVLMAKGLARKYRGRLGTPQEIERWKKERAQLTWKPVSEKARAEEFKDSWACEHIWEDIKVDWESTFQKCRKCGLVRSWNRTVDTRRVRAFRKKQLVVERPSEAWEESKNAFERHTETTYRVRDPSTRGPRISKARNLREIEYSWPLGDGTIFSISEIQVKGYCEECSNYGLLHYTDGVYLCENCRYSKMKLFW